MVPQYALGVHACSAGQSEKLLLISSAESEQASVASMNAPLLSGFDIGGVPVDTYSKTSATDGNRLSEQVVATLGICHHVGPYTLVEPSVPITGLLETGVGALHANNSTHTVRQNTYKPAHIIANNGSVDSEAS